jgi:bacterioferritin-associated ferredoxin
LRKIRKQVATKRIRFTARRGSNRLASLRVRSVGYGEQCGKEYET